MIAYGPGLERHCMYGRINHHCVRDCAEFSIEAWWHELQLTDPKQNYRWDCLLAFWKTRQDLPIYRKCVDSDNWKNERVCEQNCEHGGRKRETSYRGKGSGVRVFVLWSEMTGNKAPNLRAAKTTKRTCQLWKFPLRILQPQASVFLSPFDSAQI